MDYLKLIVELVKAVAWPTAIATIALVFRSDVRALFPRLTKAGPSGLEFGLSQQSITTTSTEARDIPGFPEPTAAIAKMQAGVYEDLKIIDQERRLDVVVRQFAVARLAWAFEQMHRTLYGSQLRSLVSLSNTASGSATRTDAEEAFNQAKSQFPQFYENNTFEEWIRYPSNTGLIHVDAASVTITELGREFLGYMGVAKLSDATRPW
ncbi:hypothetical protein MA20_47705 [Bradyrhizobium japonicum]|uniref:Uncharacterized protein n=1 Tax=Bradyrhizobium japonicum TaxID=375 RepID=A0A0A3XI81_BRAJP|nr:hypothetical protein [Bradyrhizobium japonicum]KGT72881.1 hypothetical protein MA20_47705 [Bradyrhizobium japonicum]